jgi:CTP synthase
LANVEEIKDLDGILVAPGFGERRRIKVEAVTLYENKVPFRNLFGDANGHSEYSRNVLGYSDANSTEMNEHTSILSLI